MLNNLTTKEKAKLILRRLEQYYAAENAILSGGQSYSIEGRELERADLGEIQNMILKLEADYYRVTKGRIQHTICCDN